MGGDGLFDQLRNHLRRQLYRLGKGRGRFQRPDEDNLHKKVEQVGRADARLRHAHGDMRHLVEEGFQHLGLDETEFHQAFAQPAALCHLAFHGRVDLVRFDQICCYEKITDPHEAALTTGSRNCALMAEEPALRSGRISSGGSGRLT